VATALMRIRVRRRVSRITGQPLRRLHPFVRSQYSPPNRGYPCRKTLGNQTRLYRRNPKLSQPILLERIRTTRDCFSMRRIWRRYCRPSERWGY
jgi:hypothetical protein